jgi:chromosome segregation ATPase
LTYPDLTAALQARLRGEADRHSLQQPTDSGERRTVEALEARIAALEDALTTTEAMGEQQRQAAGAAAKRADALEAHIATMDKALAAAQALGEQRHQEAETAAKRIAALEAQIATLENAAVDAGGSGEQHRRKAEAAAKRVEVLEAHIAQVAIAIKLAIMMGEGQISGFHLKRLQGIADNVSG